MSEAEAPVSGALSIDQAIAQLSAHEEPEAEAPQQAAEPEAPEPIESEGDSSLPDEAPAEAETQGDEVTQEQEAEPAETRLDPPLYWKPEAKAKFATLDPAIQAEILAQEGPREQAAAKAKAEAAEIRQAAEKEIAGIREFAEKVQPLLAQAQQTFRSRWGDSPDWTAYAQSYGVEAMVLAKTQYETEQAQVQQLQQVTQVAEAKAHQDYVKAEAAKLVELAPELADPAKGSERRAEVATYLAKQGIPQGALRNISATEMVLARKAMLWDQAQAKAKAAPAPPRPVPQQTKPLTRGAASQGTVDPKTQRAQTAKRSFAQTRSLDAAVALLNALDD